MNFSQKRWIGAAAVLITVAMGSTAAFAATTSGWHHGMRGAHRGMMGTALSTLAKDLNLSPATLKSDLKAGQSIAAIAKAQNIPTATLIDDLEASVATHLTALVTAGKITSAKEQTMQQRADTMITNFVNGTMPKWPGKGMGNHGMKPGSGPGMWGMKPHGGHGMWGMGRGVMGPEMTTLAKALNLPPATLRADLKAGQSLSAIAKTQNVPTTTIIGDLEASVTTRLTALVTAGKITSAQEQTMQQRADTMITNFVNGTWPKWSATGKAGKAGGTNQPA